MDTANRTIFVKINYYYYYYYYYYLVISFSFRIYVCYSKGNAHYLGVRGVVRRERHTL